MELPKKPVTRYSIEESGQWIFVFGSLENGLTFVGPYPSYEAAHKAATSISRHDAQLVALCNIEESTHYIKYNPDLED